jgi:hypothetical protein
VVLATQEMEAPAAAAVSQAVMCGEPAARFTSRQQGQGVVGNWRTKVPGIHHNAGFFQKHHS